MPCRCDGYPTESERLSVDNNFLKASLCAALTHIEKVNIDIFWDCINEEESGITSKELKKWWSNHKKEDENRRKREKQSLMDKQKRLKQELEEINNKLKNK